MEKEYNNKIVYDFLIEECKQSPGLWDEFEKGLMSHTSDAEFWEKLCDKLDCFRVCEECGRPMIEGYVVDGCETFCSDECLHKHLSDEEFNELYDDGDGDTFWTTWYEDSITYKNNNK